MDQELSKKEKIRLRHEQEQRDRQKKSMTGTFVKWGIGVVVLALIGYGIWLFAKESSKPLPGKQMDAQGRDHTTQEQWEKLTYNSNPPTSGAHDPEWTKPGIYDAPVGVGHLVHSLEHGYVLITYNCNPQASASATFTQASAANASALLAQPQWQDSSCQQLKTQLKDLANTEKLWKLIVIAWPWQKDTIALTAWQRIDSFSSFDKNRITNFIKAFRDKGPEATMEP